MPNNNTILVTGGAGYIGSHMVNLLLKQAYTVVVLDNLSTGHADAVPHAEFIEGDLNDLALLRSVFSRFQFDAVMHFAASIQVAESVNHPSQYYRNNVFNTVNLLDVMLEHEVKQFIFSSTAAVYGEPQYLPVDEQHTNMPLSPYGQSKYMVEQILKDYESAYGLKSISLRYFNAAGADPDAHLGPRYPVITHLILLVLDVARAKRDHIDLFGDDYKTSDGTCVRDYVHVLDLCLAHLLALEKLAQNEAISRVLNLGSGKGYSVKEVLDVARNITGHDIPVKVQPRRAGDPAVLVANSLQAQHALGWKPQYADLTTMIESTWKFMHV